jgi:lipid-binding SYLF domain-containing protein
MGADASMALGPVGAGVGASTTPAFGADIYSFVKARGAFAGGAFEGSYVGKREELNARYYGRPASARDIIFDFKVSNTGADGLRQALARK